MISRTALWRAAAVLLTALAAASGCVRPGTPIPAVPAQSALDIGANEVRPLSAPPGNEQYGRVLESVRMAEALLDPAEVDAALNKGVAKRTGPLPTPREAVGVLAAPARKVLESHAMLAGYVVTGSEVEVQQREVGTVRLLTVLLLRFPDSAAAQLAARQLDATDAAVNSDNVAVRIAGYPAAHGHWRPTAPTMAATLAHGSFVISVLAGHTAPDHAVLSGLVSKAFDVQLPRLREFQATPRERFAGLPLDPDGMVSRLLPYGNGQWPAPRAVVIDLDDQAGLGATISTSGVVYGPRGTRLLRTMGLDPAVEMLAMNGYNVLERFPDAVTARRVVTGERRKTEANAASAAAAPEGLPDVYCHKYEVSAPQWPVQFGCHVLFGRYSATIVGRNQTEARQRAAAQYLLLVNSA
ncbi:hypothetical protein [Nocardia sp. NPDC051832]|uniref:DUF7373 family lipoprotein n=1 Tax=Nocardia sp. NPDC051832 TaxID=3155673 RepID=UPI00343FE85B